MGGPSDQSEQRDRLLARSLFVSVIAFFLLTYHGFINLTDGQSMFEVTRALVEDLDVRVTEAPFVSVAGRGGDPFSKYGIGMPLMMTPFYVLGRLLSVGPFSDAFTVELLVTGFMPVVHGLLAASVLRLARRMGASAGAASLGAVGTVFGTYFLPYGQEMYSEPVVAVLLLVAAERLLSDRPGHAGVAIAITIVVRPQMAIIVPGLWLAAWMRGRLPAVLRTFLPLGLAVLSVLAYNLVRFGDLFRTGYDGEGFTTPLHEGMWGLLVDPTKSILIFAPIVILAPHALLRLRHDHAAAVAFIVMSTAATFLASATWHSWEGGYSWGPRLLLPVLPLLVAAVMAWSSARAERVRATAALFTVGLVVSASTVLVPTTAPLALDEDWGPGPAVLIHYELIPDVIRWSAEGSCPDVAEARTRHCTVALWQWAAWRDSGAPGRVATVVVTASLALLAAGAARRAWHQVRDDSESVDHRSTASRPPSAARDAG